MNFWISLAGALLVVSAVLGGTWRLAHARAWLVPGERPEDRRGPPPLVVWALAIALVAVGMLAFLLLARAWQAAAVLPLDRVAAAWAREAWSAPLQPLVRGITHLADPLALWLLGGGMALLLWRRGERALLLAWIAALGGNAVWNPALKGVYERLRPQADLSGLEAGGYSFPSGHSSGAMVAFGMSAYLAWRLLPPRWHLPLWQTAAVLIVLVGASRVYLQAHYLSDVLAGFASGAGWLALCIAAAGAWRAAQHRPQR